MKAATDCTIASANWPVPMTLSTCTAPNSSEVSRIAGHIASRERSPWNSTPRNIHSSDRPTSNVFSAMKSSVPALGRPSTAGNSAKNSRYSAGNHSTRSELAGRGATNFRSRQRIASVTTAVTTASRPTAIARFQAMPWLTVSISGFLLPSLAQRMPNSVTSVQPR